MPTPAARLFPHVQALAQGANEETLEAALNGFEDFLCACSMQDWRHLSALCSADLPLVRAYHRLLRAQLDYLQGLPHGRILVVCALLFDVQEVSRWQVVLAVPQAVRAQIRTILRDLSEIEDAHVSSAAVLFGKDELRAPPEPALVASVGTTLHDGELPFALPTAVPLAEPTAATIAVFVALELRTALSDDTPAGAVMDTMLEYDCRWPGLGEIPQPAKVQYAWRATHALGRAFAGDLGDEFADDLLSASYQQGVDREIALYCVPSRTFDEAMRARSYEVTADLLGEGRVLNRYDFGPTFAPAFLLGHLLTATEPYKFPVQLLHDRPGPHGPVYLG
jgi:hypothetical protein